MASKAIFLDRDGVITKERKDYVKSVEEMEIILGVADALAQLKPLNFKIVIISNQSAINRGLTTMRKVNEIHERMLEVLSPYCKIDGIYLCPHRPDENCECRKPRTGLFRKASSDFDIDLEHSWFIGDKESDEEAAKNVHCRYVGVSSNSPGSLAKAVSKIVASETAK